MRAFPRAAHGPATAVATVFAFIALWQIAAVVFRIPSWLLPSPATIWASFLQNAGSLGKHVAATGTGAIGGLVMGSIAGVLIATIMVHSRALERVLMPLLIIDQSIPKLALAPLFVIWFGAGMMSRIFIALVISFFPMIVNSARGFTTIDRRLAALMDTLSASKLQVFLKVRLPNAVPYIFAGLKVAVPLAIIGAVIAEFMEADSGLGYVVLIAVSESNTPLVFVAVTLMALLSLTLFALVSATEALLLRRRFAYLAPQIED